MVGEHPHVANIGRDDYDWTGQGRRQLRDNRIETVVSTHMCAADSLAGAPT